jgi:hypothetical protein
MARARARAKLKTYRITAQLEPANKRRAHHQDLVDGGLAEEVATELTDNRQVLAEILDGTTVIDAAYFPDQETAEAWVGDVYKLL